MISRILALAVGGTLALAAPAVAAPITASGADPVDSLGGPSVDLQEVRSSFDAETGAWSVTVRLHGAPSDDAWAMVNARLIGPSGEGGACVTELGGLRASTRPAGGSGAYLTTSVTGGLSRWPASTKQVDPGEREVTLSVADPALAGIAVSCVSVNLSHNGVLDSIAPLRFPATGGRIAPPAHEVPAPPLPPRPTDGGAPQGPTPPGADVALPPTVVFAQSARSLRLRRDDRVRVTVLPFARPTTGRVVLRSLAGKVLGAGPFSTPARRTVVVKIRLSRAARQAVRRRGRLAARLAATARDASGGRPAQRTLRTTIRR